MAFNNDNLYDTINNTSIKNDDVDPYNDKNILVTSDDISNIFKTYFNIEMKPNGMDEYIKAFTHSSYTINKYYELNIKHSTKTNKNNDTNISKISKDKVSPLPLQKQSSETLELLGDNVLKLAISSYLYKRYPYEDEGFMTSLKAQLEDKTSYAKFALHLGLNKYILLSKQTELIMGRTTQKILEDCFEAFMGASYLDQGFELCRKAMWIILETQIPYSDYLYKCHDYKGYLQNEFHAMKWLHSQKYKDIDCKIIDGKKYFTVGILDNKGHIIQEGVGTGKKEAEQNASMILLYKWGIIKKDQMK